MQNELSWALIDFIFLTHPLNYFEREGAIKLSKF